MQLKEVFSTQHLVIKWLPINSCLNLTPETAPKIPSGKKLHQNAKIQNEKLFLFSRAPCLKEPENNCFYWLFWRLRLQLIRTPADSSDVSDVTLCNAQLFVPYSCRWLIKSLTKPQVRKKNTTTMSWLGCVVFMDDPQVHIFNFCSSAKTTFSWQFLQDLSRSNQKTLELERYSCQRDENAFSGRSSHWFSRV